MNNNNLKPIRTEDEAREKGRKGGVISGQIRREKRKMRQILTDLLERTDENVDITKEALAISLIKKANAGDVRAFEMIMKFIGDLPTKNMENKTDDELQKDPFGLNW